MLERNVPVIVMNGCSGNYWLNLYFILYCREGTEKTILQNKLEETESQLAAVKR